MTPTKLATLFCENSACHADLPCPRCKQQASKIEAEISAERERCAVLASMFTVKPDRSIHPGIPWDKLSEPAKIAAHTTAQQIAAAIRELT
jgi:hypothetical protein